MKFDSPDWTRWTFGFTWFSWAENSWWTLYIDLGPFTVSFHIPKRKK